MATGSNDGSTLNLTNVPPRRDAKSGGSAPRSPKGKTKSFSSTPNPADVGSLGNTLRIPGLTDPVRDPDSLTEPALREFFSSTFLMADNSRRPRELVWHSCWDVYNGVYDWSSKAWWQSRANIPKVRSSVDRACSVFRKSLLRLRRFYQVQADTKRGKLKGQFTSALLDYWLDQENTLDELITAMKVGLITSTSVLKIWFQLVRDDVAEIVEREETYQKYGIDIGTKTVRDVDFVTKTKGKYAARAVDPFNFWIVPKTNRFAAIERTYSTYDEICALAEEGVYSKDKLDEIKNMTGNQGIKKTQEARRAQELPTFQDKYMRELELYHYWGDIYNTDGRVVMPNAKFTLVNKQILISPARPNPFYHKKSPYAVGSPYLVPFATYNRGMVEDVYEIAKSITELSNVIFDGAMYDALKSFAIDVDQLDDPSEADNGMYPGKTWIRKGSMSPPNSKLIETVDVGKIPTEAMNALSLFKAAFQEGTYVNEWVEGQGGKGDRTLGEVNIKTQSALEGLDEAARNIETSLIEPFLDLSARTIYQFHKDYSIPRLADEFPEAAAMLQDMSPKERYATMMGEFSFKARGLSVLIDQQQRIGEITNFLQLLAQIPGMIERLNPDELLEMVMLPLNWNVERLLLSRQGLMGSAQRPASAEGQGGGGGNSPAQEMAGRQGAQMGGATNNPMAGGGGGVPGQGQRMMKPGGGGGMGAMMESLMKAPMGGR